LSKYFTMVLKWGTEERWPLTLASERSLIKWRVETVEYTLNTVLNTISRND